MFFFYFAYFIAAKKQVLKISYGYYWFLFISIYDDYVENYCRSIWKLLSIYLETYMSYK